MDRGVTLFSKIYSILSIFTPNPQSALCINFISPMSSHCSSLNLWCYSQSVHQVEKACPVYSFQNNLVKALENNVWGNNNNHIVNADYVVDQMKWLPPPRVIFVSDLIVSRDHHGYKHRFVFKKKVKKWPRCPKIRN